MFGGGGGGLNPRKMQQAMEQMGIDVTEIDAEEVIIHTADESLVFDDADVQRMDAQGQQTYQVVGEPETRDRADSGGSETESSPESDSESGGGGAGDDSVPQADVEIVAGRTGASEADAREALAATDGDLAGAVDLLE